MTTHDLTRDDLVERLDNLAAVTDERAYAPIFKAAARRIEGLRATSEGWRLQAEEAQAEADRRVEEEREWTEREARRYAAFYPEGSDGRNTFTIFADAIRARSNEAQPGSKAEVRAEPSGSVAPSPVGWQDISTAPKTRPIVVETEAGRIFKAKWVVIGDDAVGWGTVNEDDPCPTCWTDGFCWESNADEEPSDKPVRWCELHKHSPLPSPPELQSEPVGGSNER